jgi:ubiquinol-cytochrome c reductase cytochrome c subunit
LATAALVMIGLFVMGVLYAAATPGRANAASTAADDISTGKKLFLSNCSTCHGTNAEGRRNAPSLVGVGAAAVDFQVGSGRMPMAENGPQAPAVNPVRFSEDEIRQLAAYVASLGPGPAIPDEADIDPAKGDVARGALIFRTNCAVCHNLTGKGGALTRGKYAPNLTGVAPKEIYEAMVTGPQQMPVFTDQTIPMEGKRDIAAYLKSVEDTPSAGGLALGSLGPVTEGLVGWVLGLGLLIGCAVWLGAKAS